MITIDLPWPAAILWPNGPQPRNRGHYAAVTKKHRNLAGWATLEALEGAKGFVPGKITLRVFAKPRGPLPDRDNCIAACKAMLDGIADGLGVNDRDFPTPEVVFCKPREGRFAIVLEK